jgi:hypothetical protein
MHAMTYDYAGAKFARLTAMLKADEPWSDLLALIADLK